MDFYPHEGQWKLLNSGSRFTLVSAGTQGGKSICVPVWLYQEFETMGPGDYLVVSPTYDLAQRTVIKECLERWADTPIGINHGGSYNSSHHNYHIPAYGITIHFRSAEIPKHIQGGKYNACVFDEAGQVKSGDTWRVIQQRLSIQRGRALICSTPYGYDWFRQLIDKAKGDDPEYQYINWKSIDNPYFPEEEYYARQKEWPSFLFNMMYNGEFGIPEHAIFYEFGEDNITEVDYDPDRVIYVCCDFNNSPLHWVLAQRHDQVLHVYDEIYIDYRAKTKDALDELYNRHGNHKFQVIFFGDASARANHSSADSSDFIHIYNDKRFIKLGRHMKWPKANPTQRARCASMSARIKNSIGDIRLLISPSCKHLIRDIHSLVWIPGTFKIDKKAYDGHGCDALGYCLYYLWPLEIKPVENHKIYLTEPNKWLTHRSTAR